VIPKLFHWIWLGKNSLQPEHAAFILGWIRMHPGWRVVLWDDHNLPALQNQHLYDQTTCHGYRGDLLRYQVMYDLGGVYLDVDFECLGQLDPFLDREVLLARERPDSVAPGIMGSVAGHPFFKAMLDRQEEFICSHPGEAIHQTGPCYLTAMYESWTPKFKIVDDPHVFYPFNWGEPRNIRWPETVAAHHWAGTWRKK
jgi:mannosyltransferase OCH1-like enzyme